MTRVLVTPPESVKVSEYCHSSQTVIVTPGMGVYILRGRVKDPLRLTNAPEKHPLSPEMVSESVAAGTFPPKVLME
jgi:hypothetical protein